MPLGKRSLPMPPMSAGDARTKRLRTATVVQETRHSFAPAHRFDNGEGSSSSFQMAQEQEITEAAVLVAEAATLQATASSSSRAQTNRRRSASCHALRTDSCSLGDMGLEIPAGVAAAEQSRRKDALRIEIEFHRSNPPILPPSKVEDLPPKPFIEDFLRIPEDVTPEERRVMEDENNRIAAQHQLIDRQRNNQAAKKSRQARLESLWNTRELLNAKAAECFWFRMKVISLGGSTEEWDLVPANVKARLVKEIESRVEDKEKQAADEKKTEEAKKRAERNKRRAEVREQTAQQQQQQQQLQLQQQAEQLQLQQQASGYEQLQQQQQLAGEHQPAF
ncbi:hypothetical protein M440DRAFT_1441321 [Trichoderma longibrachiatum ATCC 18648]|uniref:BZIP domain-containing protein n=1 Tax=Trichoderma longibrachiatum ATCC 18648 TaxID=983965 RepID=A0A2T4BUR8_TRILO|nr:hypothetical protein M440DRAFT_1441321 [Trichoderma longibrachiatum ATCC 18648]